VTKLANNTDQVASRKILCFFIVDPKHPIVSSLEVPQRSQSGISEAEAEKHRLQMLKERKYKMDSMNKEWEEWFSI